MPVSDFRTAGIHDSGRSYREQLPAAVTHITVDNTIHSAHLVQKANGGGGGVTKVSTSEKVLNCDLKYITESQFKTRCCNVSTYQDICSAA